MNYAHTPSKKNSGFEPWLDHAEKVYRHLLEDCGIDEPIAYILGYAHDLGKLQPQWQEWLRLKHEGKDAVGEWVEHKDFGAEYIYRLHNTERESVNYILPKVIMSHHGRGGHSGILSAAKVKVDLLDYLDSACDGIEIAPTKEEQEAIDKIADKLNELTEHEREYGHLTCETYDSIVTNDNYYRYYLSCLVYADWRATAEWAEDEIDEMLDIKTENNVGRNLEKLMEYYAGFASDPKKARVNAIRNEIREACERAAVDKQPNEVYKMSLPTGAGKTLCSIDWALRHAEKYGKTRIVVVIPYTRIIKQNAEVYRNVFGDEVILEAHSLVSYTDENNDKTIGDASWHKDIVITTDVAFFKSLYSSNVRNLLRLHALKDSVIIFDECQWIPRQQIAPCTAMMQFLCGFLNSTILLSTATMPQYDKKNGSRVEPKELIKEELETQFYADLKRVETTWIGKKSIAELQEHYAADNASALFIVNSTKYAQELFDELSRVYGDGNVYHLSKRMTQSDIDKTLDEVNGRLMRNEFIILVSTILIEAGVDISFPIVYRCQTGLDSLAQSAGRCNRNGELSELGKTYLYEATEDSASIDSPFWGDIRDAWTSMKKVYDLDKLEEGSVIDIYDADKMRDYFIEYYDQHKLRSGGYTNKFDKDGLLNVENVTRIAKDIRLIEDSQTVTVFVPRNEEDMAWARELVKRDRIIADKNGIGYHLTPEETARVRNSSVEVYYSGSTLEKIENSSFGEPDKDGSRKLRGMDMYILDVGLQVAPIVYDERKGLTEIDFLDQTLIF